MVNILRLIGVIAVISAGLVLALVVGPKSLVGLGIRGDDEVDRILESPSVVDRFKENHDGQAPPGDQMPALVRQAMDFAKILNPPAQPVTAKPDAASRTRPGTVVRPKETSAKFDLVGTSYSASNPAESFAYIRLPDKTSQWVRQGDEVGHLTIKEIRSTTIICWDGSRDTEMPVEATPDTANLLEAVDGTPAPAPAQIQPVETATVSRRSPGRSLPSRQPAASVAPKMNDEEKKDYESLVERLKELQKGTDGTGSGAEPNDRAAVMNRLISEFKSSRVSPEEAEKLGDLGEELDGVDVNNPATDKRREFKRRLSLPRSTRR